MKRFRALLERSAAHPGLTALALGVLSATGFQPLALWPLALLALTGLIELTARAQSWQRAALIGWLFGLGHFTLGNNWIATAFTYQASMPAWLGWVAVVGLAGFLALFPMLATLAAWHLRRASSSVLVTAFAGCWILAEWLRSWVFTGFPWNPLGVLALGPFDRPGLAMLAQWLGTYGLSGLVILLAGAWLIAARRGRFDWQGALLVAAPLALLGWFPGTVADKVINSNPKFTLVQPDFRQEELHDPTRYEQMFRRAVALSRADRQGEVRLVLWPESGLPDYLHRGYPRDWYEATTYAADPDLARLRIGRAIGPGTLLLTGNDMLEVKAGEVIGARAGVAAIDSSGIVRATYAKAHLVPYGEYVPLKGVLEPLGLARFVPGTIEFWPGPGPRTLDFGAWGKVGVQLCYEIIFSGQVTEPGKRPGFIFNPSNDGWYGSWGPPQFLAQARLRAIEEGLPVLRSTTTGISAVIDARGVVTDHLPHGTAGRIDGRVPLALAPTPFARLGNLLPLGWAIVLLGLSLVASRRRRS